MKADITPVLKANSRLRPAALAVNLGGLVSMTVWGLYHAEGGPSWLGLIPVLLITTLPFSAFVLLAWRWRLWGGFVLTVMAILWSLAVLIARLSILTGQPAMEQLVFPLQMIAACYLPHLLGGLLFIMAAPRKIQHGSISAG